MPNSLVCRIGGAGPSDRFASAGGNFQGERDLMKSVFIGNLNFETSESDVRVTFEQYGQVTRVTMMTDRETGRPRGFAFVEMPNDEEAATAIDDLNGRDAAGRALTVNEARPRPERASPARGEYPPRRHPAFSATGEII
jgi:cold-inducible RNA-binding protein